MPERLTTRLASLAGLASVLLPVLLYLPTLGDGFLFDDRPLLIENEVVRSPHGIVELLTTDLDPRARLSETPTTNYLRPLFLAVAAATFRLAGEQPFGWHLATVALHALLCGLAFRVLRREGIAPLTALAACLLFAFHPSHVQSTAWVSGLQDLLFGCAALGAFLAYRRSSDRPAASAGSLVALGLAYALALLAKEPAVGLLLFAVAEVAGWAPRPDPAGSPAVEHRRPWAELAVLIGTTAVHFTYRGWVLGGLAHRFPTAPDLPLALASVPVAVLAYLRDLLLPIDLFLLHPARPVTSLSAAPTLLAAGGTLVLVVALGWAGRRHPTLARPVVWSAAWLAPSLAVWALNPEWMVMDRYLLLPTLGLAWLLARLLPLDAGRRSLRLAAWLLVLGALAALSLRDQRAYASEERFWSAALAADPGSSTAWAEWGRLRAAAGEKEEAAAAFDRAIALDPRAQLPRLRRALLALSRGEAPSAAAELEALVAANPAYLPAWRNLVVARHRAGDPAGARATLAAALERFPADAMLWTQQAILLREAGQPLDALSALRRAAALSPDDPALSLREALLLVELGRKSEAAAAARRGLRATRHGAADATVTAELERLAR